MDVQKLARSLRQREASDGGATGKLARGAAQSAVQFCNQCVTESTGQGLHAHVRRPSWVTNTVDNRLCAETSESEVTASVKESVMAESAMVTRLTHHDHGGAD